MLTKFANLYELTKTVRFGITPKNNYKKVFDFSTLTEKSLKSVLAEIIENEKEKINITSTEESIEKIRAYVDELKSQFIQWKAIYEREDIIAVTKEYYKKLEREARFDGFWEDRGKKQPQASEIMLSVLGREYGNKPRREYIINYWALLLRKTEQLSSFFEPLLEKYEKALAQKDQAHMKPNLVDFRKQFLSLLNVSNKWMMPIINQSIVFPKINNASESELNKKIKNFISDGERKKRIQLQSIGKSLRDFFEANGSQVFFGKATLNYYTARQKPNKYDSEIDGLAFDLGIEEIVRKVKDLNERELKSYFKYQAYVTGDKLDLFLSDGNMTPIERIQLFKPRPIPASIRLALSERLSKKMVIPIEKIVVIFDEIGNPIDIAKEYEQSIDRENFDLNKYPIKIAFDYAWESCASFIKGRISESDFPKTQCLALLKKFNADGDDFKLYANLRYIRDELAPIEHNDPAEETEKELVYNIQRTIRAIQQSSMSSEYQGYLDDILNWIDLPKNDRNSNDARFIHAKQKIGLWRGGLKNKIRKHADITNKFKSLSVVFGENLAKLRDKLREEHELAKIRYYSVLVEDLKNNRYTLLLPLEKDKQNLTESEIENRLNILEEKLAKDASDANCYIASKVSSFTSKALVKMLKNSKGNEEFHISGEKYKLRDYDNKIKKEWGIYQNNLDFLNYVKKCLTKSRMAEKQNWKKFGWNFDGCKTYADLEREVDMRGYVLEKRYISFENVEMLVNEQSCLLFPVVNQDYASEECQDIFSGNRNPFTIEMEKGIWGYDGYHIHPEFVIFYQKPTDGYKESSRYGRFQLSVNFGLEVKQASDNFKTKKEKLKIIRDKDVFQKDVQMFNESMVMHLGDGTDVYSYGIDRGINELVTLCLLSNKNKIQDFIVFKKEKRERSAENHLKEMGNFYTYVGYEKQSILDLTNIKVETWNMQDETHPNSIFLKEAFEKITADPEMKIIATQLGYGINEKKQCTILVEYPNDRSNVLKLRMNHFQRALQFATSHAEKREIVGAIAERNFEGMDLENLSEEGKKQIIQDLFGLGSDFSIDEKKVGVINELQAKKLKLKKIYNSNQVLFLEMFEPLIQQLIEWYQYKKDVDYEKVGKMKYEELEDLDTLKRGVTANIVGVFSFLMTKFPGVIVLENVAKEKLEKPVQSNLDEHMREVKSHQEAEHHRWAGTELYRYIEKKLVQKFSNWKQLTGEILNLTPPFANLDSLNMQPMTINSKRIEGIFQFGIFCYIPAEYTTTTCPCCDKYNYGNRDKGNTFDSIICKNEHCSFDTRYNEPSHTFYNPKRNQEIALRLNPQFSDALLKIKSSDQCAAFNIAKKGLQLLTK